MKSLFVIIAAAIIIGQLAFVLPLFVSGGWGLALVLLAVVAIVAVSRDINKREEP